MDWLEFFSKLIEALAWPVAAVCIVLQFKKALSERIPALLRLTLPGGISAEFKDGFERIVAAADRAEEAPSLPITPAPEVATSAEAAPLHPAPAPTMRSDWLSPPDPITVNANPTGVVMEAWKVLEASLSTAFARLGGMRLSVGTGTIRTASISKMLNFLEERNFLNAADLEIIRELQRLRNLAAHALEPTTPSAAKSFAAFAEQMAAKVNSRSEEIVAKTL